MNIFPSLFFFSFCVPSYLFSIFLNEFAAEERPSLLLFFAPCPLSIFVLLRNKMKLTKGSILGLFVLENINFGNLWRKKQKLTKKMTCAIKAKTDEI